jgi:hypothetical protein
VHHLHVASLLRLLVSVAVAKTSESSTSDLLSRPLKVLLVVPHSRFRHTEDEIHN